MVNAELGDQEYNWDVTLSGPLAVCIQNALSGDDFSFLDKSVYSVEVAVKAATATA
jgi:hypothetical protein